MKVKIKKIPSKAKGGNLPKYGLGSTLGKIFGGVAAGVAAPFTGGASLATLPAAMQVGEGIGGAIEGEDAKEAPKGLQVTEDMLDLAAPIAGLAGGAMPQMNFGGFMLDALTGNVSQGFTGKSLSEEVTGEESMFAKVEGPMHEGAADVVGGIFPVAQPFIQGRRSIKSQVEQNENPQQGLNPMNMMQMGGDIYANKNKLYNVEGNSHEHGGTLMGNSKIAELEKGETKDGDYIFSEELGFAQKSKAIEKKYEKRNGDKLADEARRQELDALKAEQEEVRSKMVTDAYEKVYGGSLPKYEYGGEFDPSQLPEALQQPYYPPVAMQPISPQPPVATALTPQQNTPTSPPIAGIPLGTPTSVQGQNPYVPQVQGRAPVTSPPSPKRQYRGALDLKNINPYLEEAAALAPAIRNFQLGLQDPEVVSSGDAPKVTADKISLQSALEKIKGQSGATKRALMNSGMSSAQARAYLMGLDLNTKKALSETVLKEQEINTKTKLQTDQFNVGTTAQNLNRALTVDDINARNRAARDNTLTEGFTNLSDYAQAKKQNRILPDVVNSFLTDYMVDSQGRIKRKDGN